jgi:hypothetical protein
VKRLRWWGASFLKNTSVPPWTCGSRILRDTIVLSINSTRCNRSQICKSLYWCEYQYCWVGAATALFHPHTDAVFMSCWCKSLTVASGCLYSVGEFDLQIPDPYICRPDHRPPWLRISWFSSVSPNKFSDSTSSRSHPPPSKYHSSYHSTPRSLNHWQLHKTNQRWLLRVKTAGNKNKSRNALARMGFIQFREHVKTWVDGSKHGSQALPAEIKWNLITVMCWQRRQSGKYLVTQTS